MPGGLWGFGGGGSGGVGGLEVWSLLLVAVGTHICTGCSTDSGSQQRHPSRRGQIPIAPAAPSLLTSRGQMRVPTATSISDQNSIPSAKANPVRRACGDVGASGAAPARESMASACRWLLRPAPGWR